MLNILQLGPASLSPKTLVDSGSTGHFFHVQSAHLKNKRHTNTPLTLHLADKSAILSAQTAKLPFPCLPRKARTVHLFPALKGTSLISVSQLCDVGYTATFHKTHGAIHFLGKTILQGQRCPHTNLWTVDIQQPLTATDPEKTPALVHSQMVCKVTLPNTAATRVKFQLTCLFSPVLTTIAHALAASIMPTFPGLTLKALHKYDSPSIHAQKGHMDKARANQASAHQPS